MSFWWLFLLESVFQVTYPIREISTAITAMYSLAFFWEIKLIIQLYKKFNHNILVYNLVHNLSITAFEL